MNVSDDYSKSDPYSDAEKDFNPDLLNTEIKINPSFYFHLTLIRSIDALTKEDVNAGFLQYQALAAHLEHLVRAANFLPKFDPETKKDPYEEEIDRRMGADDTDMPDIAKQTKRARIKLGLLSEYIFNNKPIMSSLDTRNK